MVEALVTLEVVPVEIYAGECFKSTYTYRISSGADY